MLATSELLSSVTFALAGCLVSIWRGDDIISRIPGIPQKGLLNAGLPGQTLWADIQVDLFYCCKVITKNGMRWPIIVKLSSVKYKENLLSPSQVVTYWRRIDRRRHCDANACGFVTFSSEFRKYPSMTPNSKMFTMAVSYQGKFLHYVERSLVGFKW